MDLKSTAYSLQSNSKNPLTFALKQLGSNGRNKTIEHKTRNAGKYRA